MTILTRENLSNGSFRNRMNMDAHPAWWSDERVEASFAHAWASRP